MPLPTICLTFDSHPETATNALKIMEPLGLVGTYFVSPRSIGKSGGPSLDRLIILKLNGWEIGVYSAANMVDMLATKHRVVTNAYLRGLRDTMETAGIPVTSLAAAQRAWNTALALMVEGHFQRVRVASDVRSVIGHWQALPVPDPLYIKGGGTLSLSNNDSIQSLSAQVDDLIANGGMWSPVIHRVSDDGLLPSYTINTARFTGFCQKIATEVAANRLRCCRYIDA